MLEKIKLYGLHLLTMLGIGIGLILFFFYVYLPVTTNHGESITVPDLEGISHDDLDEFLLERNLRYEILTDSGFSTKFPALAVLKQFPLANSKVKENRKIYLTLNSTRPPSVKMPNLVDGSVKNAQLVLRSKDLFLGKIRYVPDLAANAVIEQKLNGKNIEENELIPKGSKIDLVVGDGLGRQDFEAPDLLGLNFEDAEFAIIASGLKVGNIRYADEGYSSELEISPEGDSTYRNIQHPPGAVFRQRPRAEDKIRIGQSVDLWIVNEVEIDSLSNEQRASLDF